MRLRPLSLVAVDELEERLKIGPPLPGGRVNILLKESPVLGINC